MRDLNKVINKNGEQIEIFGIAISVVYELKDEFPWIQLKIFEPSFTMGYEQIFSTPLTFNANKIFEFIYKYGYFDNHIAQALYLKEDLESDEDYEDFEDDKYPEL